MNSIYLKPGQYYFGKQPARVLTVLGSCVAVSMYHRHTGLAAICHAQSPDCGSAAVCKKKCAKLFFYINCMIPSMTRSFLTRHIGLADIEVKIFGGATLIDFGSRYNPRISVGAMNIAATRKAIKEYGLNVKSADVGGHSGRKITFDTRNGEVLLQRMRLENP